MIVVDAEDDGLLVAVGIEVLRELGGDGAVEALGDDGAVEGGDVELELVGQERELEVAAGMEDGDLGALLELDAVAGELGGDADRRLVIDQPAVDDRLAVAVDEDRVASSRHF